MRKFLLLFLLALPAIVAAQVVDVGQFPGADVATKLTNATARGCSSDINITCILYLKPELGGAGATGTLPAVCSRCLWFDQRGPSLKIWSHSGTGFGVDSQGTVTTYFNFFQNQTDYDDFTVLTGGTFQATDAQDANFAWLNHVSQGETDINSRTLTAVGINATSGGGAGFYTTDGAGNVVMSVSGTGFDGDRKGFKHKRSSTGSIGATTRTEVLMSWVTAFSNTSYTVNCTVEDSTTAAATQGLTGERIRTKSASQVGYVVNNPTAGAITGTVDCVAFHD